MLHITQTAAIAAASQPNLRDEWDEDGPEGVDGIAFSLYALQ